MSWLKMLSSFSPEASTGIAGVVKPVGQRDQPQRHVLILDGVHAGQANRSHAVDQGQVPRRMHGGQVGGGLARLGRIGVVGREAGVGEGRRRCQLRNQPLR